MSDELAELIEENSERRRQTRQGSGAERVDIAVAVRQAEGDLRPRDKIIAEAERNAERDRLRELGVVLEG